MRVLLWLLGGEVAASPGPAMQNAALRAAGIEGEYVARSCDAAGLAAAVAELRCGRATGANVTIPHKAAAAAACDLLEGDARLLGAVNTLVVEGRWLVGANTDARGLEAALREAAVEVGAARACVLGAGGAAAAAVLALRRLGAAEVGVVARRPGQAEVLAARTGARAVPAPEAAAFAATARVVVNATPAGRAELGLDVTALDPTAVVVDLRYRPRPVDTVAAAVAAGRRGLDGTGMLLHQGMLAFERWTGREPPWEAARAALIGALDG